MNKSNKIIIFLLFLILIILNSILIYAQFEYGCCTNPNQKLLVCRTDILIQNTDCCPAGDPDPNCIANFFYVGQSCGSVAACEIGCCCNSIAMQKTRAECESVWGTFKTYVASEGTDCNADFYCGVPECRDGADNDLDGCFDLFDPDCGNDPEKTEEGPTNNAGQCVTDCDVVDYEPELSSFATYPIKGEKELSIDWVDECSNPDNYYDIYRCEGSGCSNFELIGFSFDGVTQYVDDSDELLFDKTYTYKIVAHYSLQAATPNIEGTGNLGNLECWGKTDASTFCIYASYYEQYKDYLITFDDDIGETTFDANVQSKFGGKFNAYYSCDASNNLINKVECGSEVCVLKSTGAECLAVSDCNYDAGNPLGLYYDKTTCETDKYCFYDNRSFSIADNCFTCNRDMNCYDYKSRGSCEKDNCYVRNCIWKDLHTELGTGVCVSTIKDNCEWCDEEGTGLVESYRTHSKVFEACTKDKAHKLSVTDYTCYFKDGIAKSCRDVICTDYDNSADCGGPPSLGSKNQITNTNQDHCGIGVCQWINNKCNKNADGDSYADCAYNDVVCERDYFKPNTTITISRDTTYGYKYLTINIFDKQSYSSPEILRTGGGYKTYLCKGTISSCGGHTSTNYNAVTTSRTLLVSNLGVFDGPTQILTLVNGYNTISYYSEDPYKNVGIVKNVTILAHEGTDPPIVAQVDVPDSNIIEGVYYTSNLRPNITIWFCENAKINYAWLGDGQLIPPTYSKDVYQTIFEFNFTNDLKNGDYTFEFQAIGENSVSMDSPYSINIVIDDVQPNLTIEPSQGAIVTEENVPITLTFNETVNLTDVTINNEIFTNNFTSNNNIIFTATLPLTDGAKTIEVNATDYAGNKISVSSNFIVNARPLVITLKEPSYGVAPSYTFNIVIGTDNNVDCRYSLDIRTNYQNMALFDQTGGLEHKKYNFQGITDTGEHPLYVICKDYTVDEEKTDVFTLRVDTTPPIIEIAYAYPNPVCEDPPKTTLTLQTDEDTICKYSNETTDYDLMQGKFSGFEQGNFKTTNKQNISLPSEGSYTYYVGCENKAGLNSSGIINFKVNSSLPLVITDHTLKYSTSDTIDLSIDTNKNATCIYSTYSNFGLFYYFPDQGYVHVKTLTSLTSRSYTYYVRCIHRSESDRIEINFTIDTSPPEMEYVNDTSTLLNRAEFTCNTDRLRVKWLGEDAESGVKEYYYSLLKKSNDEIIVNPTQSFWYSQPGDEWNWTIGLSLENNIEYYFKVTATNWVDLQSIPKSSDGITVDTSVCQYCNASKDDCCFIEEGDNKCDPDCDEAGGVPVDPDCTECTSGQDCCNPSGGDGCDLDCPPNVDPDCIPECTVHGECDTTNGEWCNNGWWTNSSYCNPDVCGMEDFDCGYLCSIEGNCDILNNKWCENGEWKYGNDYCGHCGFYDSECVNCEQGECDTVYQKWCTSGFWSLSNYCTSCETKDYTCGDGCISCDTTNQKSCDNGEWQDGAYCDNCGSLDPTCSYTCMNNQCDTTFGQWCSNGRWNWTDYCSRCGRLDYNCGVACTSGSCDVDNNFYCSNSEWQLSFSLYCSYCSDTDCAGSCTPNSCDTEEDIWCDSSGVWQSDDYCGHCGTIDKDCTISCVSGDCDITNNKWCGNGYWEGTGQATDNYCAKCYLYDSECARTCTDGSCDTSQHRYCDLGEWKSDVYCNYCSSEDQIYCHAQCTDSECYVLEQKWCEDGLWTSGVDYCDHCGHEDSSCGIHCNTQGICDPVHGKWCNNNLWTNESYCNYCSDHDASCGTTCSINDVCDKVNKKWCDSGIWSDVAYCNHCIGEDSSCECTGSGCDTTNRRYCDNGRWSNASYCSEDHCGNEDSTCAICTNNACDIDNQKWCEGSRWQTGTYSQYCSHCAHEDSSCPECEANSCDTDNQKWCDDGSWSVVDYCDHCGNEDSTCDEECTSGRCDTTNREWCNDGEWSAENYCDHCGEVDSSCYVECTNNACDTNNKKWCDNGEWSNAGYCDHCSGEDFTCGVECQDGSCDTTIDKWCDAGSWTQLGYCDHCEDSDCPGSCTNNACDTKDRKWCDNGEWSDDNYCDHCGSLDSSCMVPCVGGTCDTTGNKRCSDGMWTNVNYCDYCALQDSDCTIACAEGECDTTHGKVCIYSEWVADENYCSYCKDYDSGCISNCTNVKDGCCNGASDNICDVDCTESADTDCTNCTSAQGDCCYPASDAVCDSDCPLGLDPDCADNACQNSGACPIDWPCTDNSDCASRFCYNKECTESKCDDNKKGPGESDVDCGGSCSKCPDGKKCNQNSDCESNYCSFGTCKTDTCFDGKLSGSETGVDCGGACPTKCSEGAYCDSDEDCVSGTKCYEGKCSVCNEENAYCGTELDTDGDGMPDEWEFEHGFDPTDPTDALLDADDDGLTNLEEFGYKTDPNNADTDGDKYKDKKEIDKGTDPLDPNDYPKSKIWIILFMLFLGVLVGGAGFVVYHRVVLKRKIEVKPARPIPRFVHRPITPARRVTPEQIRQMRIAMQRKREAEKREKRGKAFEVFGEKKEVVEKKVLEKKEEKEKKVVPVKKVEKKKEEVKEKPDAFAKLSKMVSEKQKKQKKPIKKIKKGEVFKKLKKISKKKRK